MKATYTMPELSTNIRLFQTICLCLWDGSKRENMRGVLNIAIFAAFLRFLWLAFTLYHAEYKTRFKGCFLRFLVYTN